jgi:hypothetical protein
MMRWQGLVIGLAIVSGACTSAPEPSLSMVSDSAFPEILDAQWLEETVPDTTPDIGPELPPVDLPDCPFKQCNPADYPEIKLDQCQQLGWDGETCDCAVFPKNEGALCDDDNQCSAQDYCSADGSCKGIGAKDCSDGNLCTNDSCDQDEGCIHTPNKQPCEDGNPCTDSDHCGDGSCLPGNYSQTCGECLPESDNCEILYGDEDLCNGTLSCVANQCVLDEATVVTCDSSLLPPCIESKCTPNLGECVLVPISNGTDCDDSNICTKDDYCVEGECKGFLNSELEGCKCVVDKDCQEIDDDNLCNGTLHCNDEICKTDLSTVPLPCDDSGDLECIKNLCVPSTGLCETTQLENGSFCTDGNGCSLGDACQGGTCVADTLMSCEDLNTECGESSCDPNLGGCVMSPVNEGKDCITDDPCAISGVCDSGSCVLETPIDCSDDDPCTVDSCIDGYCQHEAGGGEWTVELTTEEIPVASLGLPATPAKVAYLLTNNSSLAQGLHIYMADGGGTPVTHDWLALDLDYIVLEPGASTTFHTLLYPAAAGLETGMHVAQIAVKDECTESPKTSLVSLALSVVPTESEILFTENFDSDPFAAGRWDIYMGDCTNAAAGTVAHYANAFDGCGTTQGYVYREYKGDRCIEYTGAPFTTSGYTNLKLSYAYRLVGGSVAAAVHSDGIWTDKIVDAEGEDMAQWEYEEVAVSGVVDGLRFFLKAGEDHLRRLDCITLQGIPACTQFPTITAEPSTTTVAAGETATFTVNATGENLAYQWLQNGAPIPSSAHTAGSLTQTLTIHNTTGSDAGTYHCHIMDHCGTIDTTPAGLIVQ